MGLPARRQTVLHPAGKPIETSFIESSNGRLRDESLNVHWVPSLADAGWPDRDLAARLQHRPTTQLTGLPNPESASGEAGPQPNCVDSRTSLAPAHPGGCYKPLMSRESLTARAVNLGSTSQATTYGRCIRFTELRAIAIELIT